MTINEQGQVVGTSRSPGDRLRHVFFWEHGHMTDIGRLGDGVGPLLLNDSGQVAWRQSDVSLLWLRGVTQRVPFFAAAMNDLGQIVGSGAVPGTNREHEHAVLWERGHLRDVGRLPGDDWSEAAAINNEGIVVAQSHDYASDVRLFQWKSGTLHTLPRPPGFTSCTAVAINTSGQVLGSCGSDKPDRELSFLWNLDGVRGLGVLGLPWVWAIAMNDRGDVVGQTAIKSRRYEHAFLWRNGTMRDLGTLGGKQTFVSDINDRGQIVGSSYTAGGALHAFVWEDGVMTDLGRSGRYSTSHALAINNHGQIVGSSMIGQGAPQDGSDPPRHAVVWFSS